jgi:hypothetical protein
MTSEPVRDPLADHLLTPQNCALVIIDGRIGWRTEIHRSTIQRAEMGLGIRP